jgi:hypothetical protein
MSEPIRISFTIESDDNFVIGEDKYPGSQKNDQLEENESITISKLISCSDGLPASLIPCRLF